MPPIFFAAAAAADASVEYNFVLKSIYIVNQFFFPPSFRAELSKIFIVAFFCKKIDRTEAPSYSLAVSFWDIEAVEAVLKRDGTTPIRRKPLGRQTLGPHTTC